MPDTGLPAAVEALILGHIPSVAHLEALLLLRGEPAGGWTRDKVAARLFIGVPEAATILADLSASGLVAAPAQDGGVFEYKPASAAMAKQVDETAETYRLRLIPVTKFIHARQQSPARAFADAFRFRKG